MEIILRGEIMENKHVYTFVKEAFTDTEFWLLATMVSQMDELVNHLYQYPTYVDMRDDWYELKETMGWADLDIQNYLLRGD